MIAYKKSLVDLEPGQKTCIDYDHGRITLPHAEYKSVRPILKKRQGEPEYPQPPYVDPYYGRSYEPYHSRRYGEPYGDPFASHPYAERPYDDHPYGDRPYDRSLYGEPSYGGPPLTSRRYTDRYDVYDQPYEDRYYDPAYKSHPYDPYHPVKRSQSPESESCQVPSTSARLSQASYRPPSPIDSPPRTPSPQEKAASHSPLEEKPPLDRFLDMLSKKVDTKKKSEPVCVSDDLLPHERALQDGKGFSRIVGLAPEPPSNSLTLEDEKKQPSPKETSVERTSEESVLEPYDKIQSLLHSIGLKLSSGEVSKLASRAQEKILCVRSSSSENETPPSGREELLGSRTGSLELDHVHSQSPAKSCSLEPLSKQKKAPIKYDKFLDQQNLEAVKTAQQTLTKTIKSTSTTTPGPKPPPGPPPAHYQHPSPPLNWPLGVVSQTIPTQSITSNIVDASTPPVTSPQPRPGLPPGPPPGPPPRRPALQPPGPPPGPPPQHTPGQLPLVPPHVQSGLPFMELPNRAPLPRTSSFLQPLQPTATLTSPSVSSILSSANSDKSAISTTVARCLKVIETVKSLSVPPSVKPSKSVQFSLPTESPTVSWPSSVETEEGIKAKQKEKVRIKK